MKCEKKCEKNHIRMISSQILFAAIREELACNRQASFTVTGMSMWPFICHGRDKVVVGAVKPEELRKGDIILFQPVKDKFILHRITKRSLEYFETTGDGNLFRDGRFAYDCVIAKVDKVIRNGKSIDCNNRGWKMLSQMWIFLFPIRKQIFHTWFRIRKYIRPDAGKTK
ncbi:MAG: S24/S26 family peptidase [Lachnospiraceae bacterium]|nr:S24/S26 family peptidase [Lachnospiraceae bacterium]